MERFRIGAISLLFLLGIVATNTLFADVYRWVDEEGVEHFGNRPSGRADSTLIRAHNPDEGSASDGDGDQDILLQVDQALAVGDFDRARELLEPLATGGHPRAQNGMGLLFDRGLGVHQDFTEAARWYQLSAEQGYAKAQFNLGVMYARGEGVPQDFHQAARWYRLAAGQDHAFAQHNLAQMYRHGQGVESDLAMAFELETAAAELGDAKAQYSLGLMYYVGQGVTANAATAYKWLAKALSNGEPITVNLPPDWIVGHHAYDAAKGELLEFVRLGDTINNWRELVTIQRFGTGWGDASPQDTLERLKQMREASCPGSTAWRTIESSSDSITYEWQAQPCGGWPSQHEIARIIYRPDARLVLHYARKEYAMSSGNRANWINTFVSAK